MTLGITAGGVAAAAAGVSAAAGVAGAVMGGGGGAAGGASSGSKKLANRAQVMQEVGIGTANIENQLGKEGLVETERARQGLFDLLGSEGTWEEGYEDYVARTGGGPGVGAPKDQWNLVQETGPSMFPTEALEKKGKGVFTKAEINAKKQWEKTGGLVGEDTPDRAKPKGQAWILDPDKYIKNVSQTRQFRMMSRMTAEADQLMREEGPLWEKLKQATQNPIIQSSAIGARETQEAIARDAARGGSARNRAVAVANKIQANNQMLTERTNALWTTNLTVKQWTTDNARMQLAFNQSWVSNLNGIRDSFSGMMMNAQQFYGAQILPATVNAAGQTMNAAAQDQSGSQLASMQSQRASQMSALISGASKLLAGGLSSMAANWGGGGGSATMSGQSNYDVSGIA